MGNLFGGLGHVWAWLIDPNSAGGTGAPGFKFYVPWIIFCALGLLIPIYYRAEARKRFFRTNFLHRRLMDKFTNYLWPLATVGIVLMFCRDAQLALFGLRLWRYAWALWAVALFGYWGYVMIFRYPKMRAQYIAQRTFERYLPQPRSKRTRASRA